MAIPGQNLEGGGLSQTAACEQAHYQNRIDTFFHCPAEETFTADSANPMPTRRDDCVGCDTGFQYRRPAARNCRQEQHLAELTGVKAASGAASEAGFVTAR